MELLAVLSTWHGTAGCSQYVYGMALLAVLSTVYGMELLAVLSVGKALLSVLGVGYTRSSEIVRIPGMVLVIGSATTASANICFT